MISEHFECSEVGRYLRAFYLGDPEEEIIMVSPELTIELKEILLREFGKEVTLAMADKFGNALVNYVALLTETDKTNKKEVKNDKPKNE